MGDPSYQSQHQFGFTLIELIVVFSVMAILATAGLAAFVDFSRQQTINTVAQEIKTMVFDARSRASSQVSLCPSGQQFNGYLVLFCPTSGSCTSCASGADYQLDIRCNSTDTLVAGTAKKLPPKITITPESHTLLFSPITGTVSSPCDSPAASSWNINVSGFGKPAQTVSVYSSGIVK